MGCFAPPPPNEECEFRSGLFGGPSLNLSTVKGHKYQLTQINNVGRAYVTEFTPCANGITCESAQSSHSATVMADVRYYCNPSVKNTLNITKAYENGPCQFRIDIDTNFACKNATQAIYQ